MEAIVKASITYCDGISKGLNLRKRRLSAFCVAPWNGLLVEGQASQQLCTALISVEGARTKDSCTFYGSWPEGNVRGKIWEWNVLSIKSEWGNISSRFSSSLALAESSKNLGKEPQTRDLGMMSSIPRVQVYIRACLARQAKAWDPYCYSLQRV